MKTVVTSSFLVVLAPLLAATAPLEAQAPRAVPEQSIHDAGAVSWGGKIEHTFVIRNEGRAELVIRDVEPTCGCTVAEYDATIAPGESGRVQAVVDTKSFRGPIAKSVSVFTNDPQNPELRLVIKADVRTPIEIKPVYARFMTVVGEERPTSEHFVWSTEGPPLEVQRVESPYPFLEATIVEAGDEEKLSEGGERQWKLTLKLQDGAPVGPLADFVQLFTNHPDQRQLKLPVSGYVRPILAVTPQRADFGRRDLSEPYEASLEVRNLGSSTVALTSIAADVAGIETEIEEVEEGKIFMVRLTLTPEMDKGPFEGKLQIETTSPRQPHLEIELRGTVL